MHQYQANAAVHLRPVKADPPLKSKAPKPAFINAKQNSAFSFNSTVPHNNNGESHRPSTVFYNSSTQIFFITS